jgi:hypothetical protein
MDAREVREKTSIEHVTRARQLANENSAAIGEVTNEHVAIVLGRLARVVEELDDRLAIIEQLVAGRHRDS